ncbi:MAG: nucleotide-binding protein [Deltaproteobacteria bacterium]|nr:nucleotide-binding protein [Deltaproteobacteria bacterium]
MALPLRVKLDDMVGICKYLASKPTGATIKEAKSVLGDNLLTQAKIFGYKYFGILEETDDKKLKLTEDGRKLSKGGEKEKSILLEVIRRIPAYSTIIERAALQQNESIDSTELAAHWHEHFNEEAGDSDRQLKERAVCFFHIASAAGLGTLIPGRKGNATRISFNQSALKNYLGDATTQQPIKIEENEHTNETNIPETDNQNSELGQAIFIGHGKNKEPLEQLKKILDQFHVPYKVAVDEPNLGRPISGKVREVMRACNCAILIFTADEELKDKDGNTIWRPSENVVFELGATGYLYDNRLVILKEENVTFPSNFNDLGYISFAHDKLEVKAMDVLKELIGFGIIRITT